MASQVHGKHGIQTLSFSKKWKMVVHVLKLYRSNFKLCVAGAMYRTYYSMNIILLWLFIFSVSIDNPPSTSLFYKRPSFNRFSSYDLSGQTFCSAFCMSSIAHCSENGLQ